MRPAVAVFCVLALGALFGLGSFLKNLIGARAPADAHAEEEVTSDEAPQPEAPRAAAPARPAAPGSWLTATRGRTHATPRFAESVFERTRAVEALREQSKQDGFLFREAGSDKVYVVQRGTRFQVSGPDEVKQLGYKWEELREVPAGTMQHLFDRPPDRALFRERGDPKIYTFENGVKRWISDADAFNRNGFDWGAVRVTPTGALSTLPTGEPIQ